MWQIGSPRPDVVPTLELAIDDIIPRLQQDFLHPAVGRKLGANLVQPRPMIDMLGGLCLATAEI
jgi:hypothetical protein